jgi:hypothetical protein
VLSVPGLPYQARGACFYQGKVHRSLRISPETRRQPIAITLQTACSSPRDPRQTIISPPSFSVSFFVTNCVFFLPSLFFPLLFFPVSTCRSLSPRLVPPLYLSVSALPRGGPGGMSPSLTCLGGPGDGGDMEAFVLSFCSPAVVRPSSIIDCTLVWEAAVVVFSTRGVINGPSSTDSVRNWLLAVDSFSSLC